jgi:serine/threonine protein kinase
VELCKISLLDFLRQNPRNFRALASSAQDLGKKYLRIHITVLLFIYLLENVNVTHLKNFSSCSYQNTSVTETFTVKDMTLWSAEIARGMDFISSKKVVHGDLAARNVLFSFDMKPKICDFGLARQLVNYNYIKTQQVRNAGVLRIFSLLLFLSSG